MREIYLLFITLCLTISFVNSANLPDLYWNSSNPLFDDTEFEPSEIRPRIMDAITIHCPFYHKDVPSYATQQMKIYRVSEEAYEKCYLDSDAKEVALCQTPYQRNHIRIVFREFSPLPGALEYAKRQSYYFISTSDGSSNGINKTHGGLCARHNMRLRVHVHMRDHPIRHHGHGHSSIHRPKKPFEYNANKEAPAPALASTVAPTTSTELPFWNEFLSKLAGNKEKPTQTRPKIGYWPHPRNTHSNAIGETVELDSNSEIKNGLEYDRGQSVNEPEALNDPNYKLFEIHEIDEIMSSSSGLSLCWLLVVLAAVVMLN